MRCLGFIMMMTGLLSLIPGQGYATEEKEQQADYEISAPDQATIGSKVQVGWSGKQVTGNYITIVPPSAAEGEYRQYAYTAEGATLGLSMPLETGVAVFAIFVSLYLSQRVSRPHADGPGTGDRLPDHLGPPNQKTAGFTRKSAQTGTVTLIQRFGSALNLMCPFTVRHPAGDLRSCKSAILPICRTLFLDGAEHARPCRKRVLCW